MDFFQQKIIAPIINAVIAYYLSKKQKNIGAFRKNNFHIISDIYNLLVNIKKDMSFFSTSLLISPSQDELYEFHHDRSRYYNQGDLEENPSRYYTYINIIDKKKSITISVNKLESLVDNNGIDLNNIETELNNVIVDIRYIMRRISSSEAMSNINSDFEFEKTANIIDVRNSQITISLKVIDKINSIMILLKKKIK
ncbi:hypothetical protein ACVTNF_002035 [Photobacterium damselae]